MVTSILFAALLAVPGAAANMAPELSTIAIYPLQPLGTEQEIADRLDQILRAEVNQIRGVALQGSSIIEEVISSQSGIARSCESDACLAKVGRDCEVQRLVFGTVASMADSYVLDLKLISVAGRKLERRESASLSGDKAVLIDGVRAVATRLIAPEQFVGSLQLKLDEPGAEVYLDGWKVGTTPLKRLNNLQPGQHALKIVLSGYEDFDRFIEIRFSRTTIVVVELSGSSIHATIEAEEIPAGMIADPEPPPTTGEPVVVTESSIWGSPTVLAGFAAGGQGALLIVAGGIAAGIGYLYYPYHLAQYTTILTPAAGTGGSVVKEGVENEFAADLRTASMLSYGGLASLGLGAALAALGSGLVLFTALPRDAESDEEIAPASPVEAQVEENAAEEHPVSDVVSTPAVFEAPDSPPPLVSPIN